MTVAIARHGFHAMSRQRGACMGVVLGVHRWRCRQDVAKKLQRIAAAADWCSAGSVLLARLERNWVEF
jgi:hypothetical protein